METLAEDLLLLGLDDESGAVSWQHATALPYGLGGALLMDLTLLGRLGTAGGLVTVVDPSPTGDTVLDAALAMIRAASRPRDATHWVRALGERAGLREELARRLVARGILREEERSFLRVFHSERFPTGDPDPELALRGRIREVTLAGVPSDDRTLMLISLVNACGLTDVLFTRDERGAAKRTIKALVEGEQFGKAVGKAVAAVVAAVAATSAAYTVVVAPGAHH
ncbi:MAG TPA: GPP34 family phosphoprotein [Thermomicrobiaceae bacterium]|nr:GPP34 family phosphoprotein [Thermomicrobiaceae bacterium]